MRKLLGMLIAVDLSSTAAVPKIEGIGQAIRSNDLAKLRQLVPSREAANIRNGLKATPLHYAAMYGFRRGAPVFLGERGGRERLEPVRHHTAHSRSGKRARVERTRQS